MSWTGWSTSNFFRLGSNMGITAVPLSIAAWVYPTTTVGNRCIAIILDSAGAAVTRNQFQIGVGGALATASVGDGSGRVQASSSPTSFTANTWNHVCGTFTSATARLAYLNGTAGSNAANSRVPTGINRTSIGVADNAAIGEAFDSGGRIAELTFWNIVLSATDVAALAKGIHPFLIHPEAIVSYFPLVGAYSPEINLKSNTNIETMQGTLTKDVHPRIFMPSIHWTKKTLLSVRKPFYRTPLDGIGSGGAFFQNSMDGY